jgi:hypothetical protein
MESSIPPHEKNLKIKKMHLKNLVSMNYHKHKKNWTTRFPNHMNENKLGFKSRSWNKKIKS